MPAALALLAVATKLCGCAALCPLPMNNPVRTVYGWPVQQHAMVSGFSAARGSTVELSMVNLPLILQHMPRCLHIRTYLMGIWCDVDNTAWQDPSMQAIPHVLRAKHESSNGHCVCHGVGGGNGCPAADPNSLLMYTVPGLLAGHVHKDVAEAMAVVGLTGSCRPISRAPGILPMCQMLALTDPNQFVAGAGPLPRAIGLDIYVFGPANPPNRATFDTMETNLVNLVNALQPPFAAHPGHTAAPLALNAVPMQVQQHDF